jgi:uncharacterized protein YkwD
LKLRHVLLASQTVAALVLSTGCYSAVSSDEARGPLPGGGEGARCVSPEDAARMADQVLQLVNLERAERNLQPVVLDERLAKIADNYACRMVTGGFFGHRDPVTGDGLAERAVAGKYTFYAIGENLAAGPETPAEVMKVWMESESHRDIILDPIWRELGIAVRANPEYSIYWVQEFGDPASF